MKTGTKIKIGLLSIVVFISFALSTLWIPTAAAQPSNSTQEAKYSQSKSKKALKKAIRAKRAKALPNQVVTVQSSPAIASYTPFPENWNAPAVGWNTAATSGGGAAQTQSQPVPAAAQTVAPQTQMPQAPATVCYSYNPCVSCWTVPSYTWNIPATSGNTPRPVLQRILPPLPRPGASQGTAMQQQVQQQPQAQQRLQASASQASSTQTTVCSNIIPSWWPNWASLCR